MSRGPKVLHVKRLTTRVALSPAPATGPRKDAQASRTADPEPLGRGFAIQHDLGQDPPDLERELELRDRGGDDAG